MPIRVQLPNGNVAEFPDGMSNADIEAAIRKIDPVDIAPNDSNIGQAWDVVGRAAGGLTKAAGGAFDAMAPDRAAPIVAPMSDADYENVGGVTSFAANTKNAANRAAELGLGLMSGAGRLARDVSSAIPGENALAKLGRSVLGTGGSLVGAMADRVNREEQVEVAKDRAARGLPSLMDMDRGEALNRSGAAVTDFGGQVVQTHTGDETLANQQSMGAAFDRGFGDWAGQAIRHPGAAIDTVAPSLIEFAAPGGVAGRASRAAILDGAMGAAERAAAKVAADGGDALAQAAARTEALTGATQQALERAGTVASATQAGQSAAMQGQQSGADVMAMSPEQLAKLPGFVEIERELGFDQARQIASKMVADATAVNTGAINLVTYMGAQRLGLNPFDTAIAGGRTVAGAAGAATGLAGRAARAGVHGAQEAAGEFLQGAGEQVGQNLGGAGLDPGLNAFKDAGKAGLMEAAVGGVVGAGTGLASGSSAPPVETATIQTDSGSTTLTAPGAGNVVRAASDQGPVPVAQASEPVPSTGPLAVAAPAPDPSTPVGRGAAEADALMAEAGVGQQSVDPELSRMLEPYAPDETDAAGVDMEKLAADGQAAAAEAAKATGVGAAIGAAPEQVEMPTAATETGIPVSVPETDPADAPSFGHAPWPVTIPDTDPLWRSIPGGRTSNIDTPERKQLRQRIMREPFRGLSPARGRKPVAYLMGGGGASGKGSLLSLLQEQGKVPKSGAVMLDPDEIKAQLPEYLAMVERGDSRAAHVAHEESSNLAAEIRRRATGGGYDMVLDRTLGDPAKARAELAALRDAGYEVRLFGITLDPSLAVDRGYKRAQRSGRYVPVSSMLSAHKGFAEGFETYLPYVDSVELYDNSGSGPVAIAEGGPGGLDVTDRHAYDEFAKRKSINEKSSTNRQLAESVGGGRSSPVPGAEPGGEGESQGAAAAVGRGAQGARSERGRGNGEDQARGEQSRASGGAGESGQGARAVRAAAREEVAGAPALERDAGAAPASAAGDGAAAAGPADARRAAPRRAGDRADSEITAPGVRADLSGGRGSSDDDASLSEVARAGRDAATSPDNDLPDPTQAQKDAGNYAKGHIAIGGLNIAIENPAGSRRRPEWPPLKAAYGYVKDSEGADGDHVDVFLSDDATDTSLPVFVIDQRNRDGSFDEHKVMIGYPTEKAARAGYLSNYTKGWTGLGAIREMSFDQFKGWVADRAATALPVDSGTDPITQAVVDVLTAAGVPKQRRRVKVVETIKDLPDGLRSAADGQTDGLYNPADGSVYVIKSALPTDPKAAADRAVWVAWHELAGHHGLRAAFPGAALVEALNDASSNPAVRTLANQIQTDRAADGQPIDALTATEEALAELAAALRTGSLDGYGNTGGVAGVVSRVVRAIKVAISKAFGGKIPYSDQQVRQLLEDAMQAVRNDAQADAGAGVLQSRRTPAEAVIQRNQTLSVLNRNGFPVTNFNQSGSQWKQTIRTGKAKAFHNLRQILQDRMIGVRSAQSDIEAAIGREINDLSNVYLAENLMHGKAADGVRRVRETLIDPLKRAVKDSGIPLNTVEHYLWAKHALERNKRIASINKGMPDGGSGLSNADANKILSDLTNAGLTPKLEAIAKMVEAIRTDTLNTLRNSGQITPEQFRSLRSMYQHYVPLRGHDGVEGEQRVGGGRGIDMRGKPVQRALGRNSKPANILGELVGDAERAQVQAAKADAGRALLRAALEHPNPDYWQVERVTTERRYSEATGEVYTGVVNDATEEDTVIVKHDGKPYRVRLVDPDLRAAMKNLGVEGFEGVSRYLGWVNRWLSAVFTRYNPAFVPVNLLRDIIQGSIGVASELGGKAVVDVAKIYPKAAAGLYAEAKGRGDASVPDAQKTMADWAREFHESGATTGYQTFADPEAIQRQIESEMAGFLQMVKQGKPIAAVSEALRRSTTINTIEMSNDIIENTMRLSVYVNRRQAGVSKTKAAAYAKNLTVNFNRKGSGAAVGNALFLFFNASMQGSHRTLKLLKDPRVVAGLAGIGATQFAIAVTLGAARYKDDDETLWEQIPDHVKQKAFVIPTGYDEKGGPQYVAIPMPFGFNLFTYVGGYPANLASDTWRSRHNPVKKTMGDIARAGVDAFSVVPVGEEGWYFPTVMRIFSNLQANRDDLGRKIRSEQPFENFEQPRASQGKSDTPGMYKDIATLLNRIGGGDDYTKPVSNLLDWAPEDIEYLTSTFTGGPGTALQQLWRGGEKMGAGLPTRPDDLPVVRRVYGSQSKPQVDSTTYYDSSEVMERGLQRMKDVYAKEGEEAFYKMRDRMGPQFAGVDLARYKSASRDGEKFAGDVRTSDKGTPELEPIEGSSYDTYKQVGKAVKGYGAAIKRVYNDKTIDRQERRRQIDALQQQRSEVMRIYIDAWNEDIRQR